MLKTLQYGGAFLRYRENAKAGPKRSDALVTAALDAYLLRGAMYAQEQTGIHRSAIKQWARRLGITIPRHIVYAATAQKITVPEYRARQARAAELYHQRDRTLDEVGDILGISGHAVAHMLGDGPGRGNTRTVGQGKRVAHQSRRRREGRERAALIARMGSEMAEAKRAGVRGWQRETAKRHCVHPHTAGRYWRDPLNPYGPNYSERAST